MITLLKKTTKFSIIYLVILTNLLIVACNNKSENINQNSFFCEKQSTTKTELETWSVMYKKTPQEINPWLNITQNLFDNNNLEKSCNDIANKLEKLTQEGLIKISYSLDSNNQNQYFLCGETTSNPNKCSIISTFKATENINKSFREITQPLLAKSKQYTTTSGGTSVTYSSEETTNSIDINTHL